MKPRPVRGLTIRMVLVLGFGLTLGLWLLAGYYVTTQMARVQSEAAAINARYVNAQEQLSTVRAHLLLASVYVRDALLDPDPTSLDGYRIRMQQTLQTVEGALHLYVPVLGSLAEQERIARVQREVNRFRETLLQVLATDRARWPIEARTLLRGRVMPGRELALQLSEEAQALNRASFVQQQKAVADTYETSQRSLWRAVGVALAASIAIGLLATLYAGRLEERLRAQRLKDVQNTRDLQRLSAQLVNAQEDERRTIARELHDEVGQVLMAMKVELVLAKRDIETVGANGDLLTEATSLADAALQSVRDLSRLLRPAVLDDLGLPAALDAHLRVFLKRHGLHGEIICEQMDDRLAPQTELAAYRIVQEALTNIAKHARAGACRISLRRLQDTVLLIVEDDGIGFDAALIDQAGSARGLGLLGIRERATQVGGTVRVESLLGGGTRVRAELPARQRMSVTDLQSDAASASPFEGSQVVNG